MTETPVSDSQVKVVIRRMRHVNFTKVWLLEQGISEYYTQYYIYQVLTGNGSFRSNGNLSNSILSNSSTAEFIILCKLKS